MDTGKASKVVCFPTAKVAVNGWLLKSNGRIGESSSFAKVFIACKKRDCKYVIKIISGSKTSKEEIETEANMQNDFAKAGLALPVEDWWVCKDREGGAIITRLLEGTLGSALKDKTTSASTAFELIMKALKIVQLAHENKLYHGDTHTDNIMLDDEGNLYFIDMARSGDLERVYTTVDDNGAKLSKKKLLPVARRWKEQILKIGADYVMLANNLILNSNVKTYSGYDLRQVILDTLHLLFKEVQSMKATKKGIPLSTILRMEAEMLDDISGKFDEMLASEENS